MSDMSRSWREPSSSSYMELSTVSTLKLLVCRKRERLLALGIGIPMYVMEMAKFSQQGQTRLKRESKQDGKKP